jgi:chromosome segregation ATPase
MWRHTLTMTMLVLSLFVNAKSVLAQVERSGGGGVSQKILQEYQQLAAERTTLQAKIAQLQKDLDAAKAETAAMKRERDALKAQVGGAAGAVAQAVAGKQSAEQSLEQSKQRMTELVARFRETAVNLKEVEADRNAKTRELADRGAAFDQCAENNLQLYGISKEVLDRYEHVGLFTKVSAAEPFTRITRARMENLVDDYRARAQELRIKRQASPPKN